ncbi:reverse transcriptase domain-containing protein [Tanacetum coccineum]
MNHLFFSQQSLAPSTQLDSGFAVPSFLPTDDPIASLNKAMMFLSTTISSRFPLINNQLRTSSNPRTQATIQDGRVIVQNIQGRQSQGYAVNAGKSQATGTRVINTVRDVKANQPRAIRCHNCKGEGHISKKCTTKKRVKDSEWFKEKMLLAHTTFNFKAYHVDTYDSDCDDEATASAIFMASLSPAGSINRDTVGPTYDSELLSEVPHYDTYHETNVINSVARETEYTEHLVSNNNSYDELTSDSNVISYADYMVTIENDATQYVPPLKKIIMI